VYRIVRQDLKLKCLKKRRAQELTAANCASCLIRAKKLLHLFPASVMDFIFFTDEKIFSVAAPTNLQNDRVYVPATIKKRENSCRATSDRWPIWLLDVCLSYQCVLHQTVVIIPLLLHTSMAMHLPNTIKIDASLTKL